MCTGQGHGVRWQLCPDGQRVVHVPSSDDDFTQGIHWLPVPETGSVPVQQGWLWSKLKMLHNSLVPTNHQWTLSLHIVMYNTNLSNVVYFFISAVNNQSPVVDICVYSDINAGITFHWVIPKTNRRTGTKISVVTLIFLQWLSMNYFIDTFLTGSGTENWMNDENL